MTEKYILDNGLSVVLNPMPYMKSVSTGIFIKSGSLYEQKENNGIAHFIEHMLFKGTRNRTAQQISEESDELGGTLNAYTAEECTCLYIKVLARDIKKALNLLFDIAFAPVFDEASVENEKKVIIEEISGANDNPEDAVQEMLMSNMFKDHPVGMPVLGSDENVRGFTREKLLNYYNEHYIPENMIVSVAGSFEPENVKNIIRENAAFVGRSSRACAEDIPKANICGGVFRSIRKIGQLQLAAGYPCASRFDEDIYSFILLAGILSSDSSSRLFRRLRDENGLVYNVEATIMEYKNAGAFVVTTGFSSENTETVINIIKNEINDILENGVTEKELERTKRNVFAALEMDLEGTMPVMSLWGKRMLYGITLGSEQIIEKYEAVTTSDIKRVAQKAFGDKSKEAVAVVGDCKKKQKLSIIA